MSLVGRNPAAVHRAPIRDAHGDAGGPMRKPDGTRFLRLDRVCGLRLQWAACCGEYCSVSVAKQRRRTLGEGLPRGMVLIRGTEECRDHISETGGNNVCNGTLEPYSQGRVNCHIGFSPRRTGCPAPRQIKGARD